MKTWKFLVKKSAVAALLASACLACSNSYALDMKAKYPVDATTLAAEQSPQLATLPPLVQKVRLFMYQMLASRLNAIHNAGVFSDYVGQQNCSTSTANPDNIQKDAEVALTAWFNAERELNHLDLPPGLTQQAIEELEQAKRAYIDEARTNQQFAATYADAVTTRAKGATYEADLKVTEAATLANNAHLMDAAALVHMRTAARSLGDKEWQAYM